MSNVLDSLSSYTAHVMVLPELKNGGFPISIGLLGHTYTTGPTVTKRILESADFELLSGNAKALRILEVLLEGAQQ